MSESKRVKGVTAKSTRSLGYVDEEYLDLLRHMLGAGPHYRKSSHGFRNRFCAEVGSDNHNAMLAMARIGLVKAVCKINNDRDEYFAATREGCLAIGLHKAAIKRALGE